jgi:hypothetical protein
MAVEQNSEETAGAEQMAVEPKELNTATLGLKEKSSPDDLSPGPKNLVSTKVPLQQILAVLDSAQQYIPMPTPEIKQTSDDIYRVSIF